MEKDVSWKEYFRDDERYADVFNGIGCGGMQLVAAEDLQEVDTQTIIEDGKIDMCQALKELLADGSLDVQRACVYLECTQEEFMRYVKEVEK